MNIKKNIKKKSQRVIGPLDAEFDGKARTRESNTSKVNEYRVQTTTTAGAQRASGESPSSLHTTATTRRAYLLEFRELSENESSLAPKKPLLLCPSKYC
ncbi:hypothetical protein RR48_04120 [Papilio machaon]|uniref:Uncharacterized protein n=1 Tax=Papilio machaon TaxID=76193 RepID=A0A0N1IQC6_PAPMA|nr:hypothetical protein RR48_04120 [Papilio machaon]